MNDHCMALWAVRPEIALAGLALVLVPLAGWARGAWRRLPAWLALLGLVVAMVLSARLLTVPATAVFCGTYAVDPFRAFYQLVIQTGAFVTILMLMSYFDGHRLTAHAPMLVLFATVGAMGLVSSLDLGLIILFLQVLSVPSYVLVGLVQTDTRAHEAMLKYFIYGASALAVMAYGMSFLYGLTSSLDLHTIARALSHADAAWIAVVLGLVLIGFAFEITLVPFHFWAPDALEGATAPVAGFISVIPKVAAFAALTRLLAAMPVGSLLPALLAAVTMSYGNLVALRQSGLKRLLAYSSIAQMGYVLMALAAARSPQASAAIGLYLLVYLLMNLAAFAVVAYLERAHGTDRDDVLRGLARTAPLPAAVLALALLSLAGIPPLAGFVGKVLLLSAVINGGLVWLAMIAAINMTVALFYYARLIGMMYFETPAQPPLAVSAPGYGTAWALTTAGTVALGVLPALAWTFAQYATVWVR